MARPRVSVVVPTFNRRDLVIRAIDSIRAQTLAVEEIIVVDDGSTDGTLEVLEGRFGAAITCLRQANAGVSAARNRGIALARGQYVSFLDSDDEWLPEKTLRQTQWLDEHPNFAMVLCDVMRVTREGQPIDVMRRREFIPEDGMVLRWVLRNPSLVPASIMLRREALEVVGGFDPSLRTAEDIDFHLRVAARWPIGVVSESLVRAMREHDGLSALPGTYDDYQGVVERFVAEQRGRTPDADLDSGIAWAAVRNARGLILCARWNEAVRLAMRALTHAHDWPVRSAALKLTSLALRRVVAMARGGLASTARGLPAGG